MRSRLATGVAHLSAGQRRARGRGANAGGSRATAHLAAAASATVEAVATAVRGLTALNPLRRTGGWGADRRAGKARAEIEEHVLEKLLLGRHAGVRALGWKYEARCLVVARILDVEVVEEDTPTLLGVGAAVVGIGVSNV